jgi:hypothetical protein
MRVTTVEAGTSKYPWADWLDGRVWLLQRELGDVADFSCLDTSMQAQARGWGLKLGVAVCTRLVSVGLLVQAYPVGSTWKPNLSAIDEKAIKRAMANPR